jgi:flagellin
MTRINTNVSSLVAQNTLGRSNAALEQALTRLSTGLRINTGKDDPAGLIASENLRSDITSIKKAIGNTDRANQVIATADSALDQVSGLLNDIRGLVTESANTGALSEDQIAANQLQIDSSLEALNRIAQTTTFQGRKLLDGSLDFLTSAGANFTRLSDLQIDQANLGATGQISVGIEVSTAATQAQVDIAGIPVSTAAANATASISLTNLIDQASGTLATQSEAVGTLTVEGGVINLVALDSGLAAGAEGNQVANLVINFGAVGDGATYVAATNTLTVDVNEILTAADVDDVVDSINAGTDFSAAIGSGGANVLLAGSAAAAAFALTGGAATVNISADALGAADGAEGNEVANLLINFGQVGAGTSYDASTNTLEVDLTQAAGTATLTDLMNAVNGGSDFTIALGGANGNARLSAADDTSAVFTMAGGRNAGTTTFSVQADEAGTTANGVTVTIAEDGTDPNTVEAEINGSGNILVHINGTVTKADIVAAINGLEGYSATTTLATGDSNYVSADDTAPGVGTLLNGVAASGGLAQDAVFAVAGLTGAEVFNFEAGTSITQLANAINLVQDATGVAATVNGTTLELVSTRYGTDAFVDVELIEEEAGGTIRTAIGAGDRDNGTDVVASVNGISAKANGNVISVNTATLDLSTTIETGFTGSIAFDITGGGAQFQLGPEVVSNQQARIGITSVNTARLGGVSGKLFQLGSGGSADLSSDPTTAAEIVDEAINQVTSLRGRLGAFQRTSLETNKAALGDTLVNLTEAESLIRDADFAEETAALTRAQILVQSGTVVLQIANQNPQNVLALLQ